MVSTTLFVPGSIFDTVLSCELAIQTEPAPAAIASGLCPTGMLATMRPEPGSSTPAALAPTAARLGPPARSTMGTTTAATTTIAMTATSTGLRSNAPLRVRPAAGRSWAGGAIVAKNADGSSASDDTRITRTGSTRPFSETSPRSSYAAPSTRRARWVTSRLARTSPALAWPHNRAARLSAPPR